MGELVNLNRVRKARTRTDQRIEAAANRAAHGRTKAQRSEAEAQKAALDRTLDGARREDD